MSVLQLYPPGQHHSQPLQGLYLGLNLHHQAEAGNVHIYANYIASVDGRISLRNADTGEFGVPAAIANPRDWRLYQELAAQAEVMIVSARYMRQLAKGCAQDLLPVGQGEAYADLITWRQQQGLSAQPDVLILSASLDIPAEAIAGLTDRKLIVMAPAGADREKAQSLIAMGAEVRFTAADQVNGQDIRQWLIQLGYRSAYMIAGPQVHHTLVNAGVLDHLFLTTYHTLLGGDDYHTILEGDLSQAATLQLKQLYLDAHAPTPQHFAHYLLSREP